VARNSSGDLPYNPVALFAFVFVAAIALMVAVVLVFAAIPVAVLLWLFSPGNRLDFDTKIMIGGATVFITLVVLFSMDPTAGLIALAITAIAGGFWYFNHPWFAAKEAYDRAVSNYRPAAAATIESVIADDVRGLALQIPASMVEVAHVSMFRAYAEDYDAPPIPNFPAFDLRYEQRALTKVIRETREAIKIREAQHNRAELTYDLVCDHCCPVNSDIVSMFYNTLPFRICR